MTRIVLSTAIRAVAAPPIGAPSPKVLADRSVVLSNHAGTGARAIALGRWPLRTQQAAVTRPAEFYGRGTIHGQVTIETTPARRKVRLFDSATGLLVAELWSALDGSYRFTGVDATRSYFVLAQDHLRQFNAVITDFVAPDTASL